MPLSDPARGGCPRFRWNLARRYVLRPGNVTTAFRISGNYFHTRICYEQGGDGCIGPDIRSIGLPDIHLLGARAWELAGVIDYHVVEGA